MDAQQANESRDAGTGRGGRVDPGIRWIAGKLRQVGEEAEILDLGCSSGQLALHIVDDQPGRRIVGVDPSERAISNAREGAVKRNASGIEFHKAELTALPFEEKRFGAVISHMALHRVEDKRRALSEIRRVMRRDGWGFLQFLGGGAVLPEWQGLLRSAWKTLNGVETMPDAFHTLGTEQLESLLGEFAIEEFEIIRRRHVREVEPNNVDGFFQFYRSVGGLRDWGLSNEDAQAFRQAIDATLKIRYEQDGPLPVTVDRVLVSFRREMV